MRLGFAGALGFKQAALVLKREFAFLTLDFGQPSLARVIERAGDAGLALGEGGFDPVRLRGDVCIRGLQFRGGASALVRQSLLELGAQFVGTRGEITFQLVGPLDGVPDAAPEAAEQFERFGDAQEFIRNRCGFWRGLVQGIQCG